MKILVTGVAGFIGSSAALALLRRGDQVIGVDNLSPYGDAALKQARLGRLEGQPNFQFVKADLADRATIEDLFAQENPEGVVNLAAQPGVRYSLENPHLYVGSNIVGFLHILEGCRHHGVKHLVFASSSSVYGANTKIPYSVGDNVDHPMSLYAATKKSNELMAHTYAHLYQIPVTGLRFFTVYGPWGRPDMAPLIFTRKILAGEPIDIFNHGKHARDFTYIDDIVEGILRTLDSIAKPNPAWDGDHPDPSSSSAPYRLYNIGNNKLIPLMSFIETIEKACGRAAIKNFLPMQSGDIEQTLADVDELIEDVGFEPATTIEDGIRKTVAWYREFYDI